ncbi:MAG: C45 family peptidase [Planctomycetota bacterium]
MPAPPHLTLTGDSPAIGLAHGRSWPEDIAQLAEERTRLSRDAFWAGQGSSRIDVAPIAQACWDAQQRYDERTTAELEAMAQASGVPAEDLLIAGGFTDFVDAVRAAGSGPVPPDNDPGQCTAVLVSTQASADGRPYLAQTWDMHPSATAHLRVLTLRPTDQPACVLLTLAGCVGMTGINHYGVAVGINNLATRDGRPGVLWPSVVRKMLRETSADGALRVLRETPLAGAHHYLILDPQGVGYSVEATPTRCAITPLLSVLAHTNHCLAEEAVAVEAEKTGPASENTRGRLASARVWLAKHGDRLHRLGLRDMLCLTGADGDTSAAICHGPYAGYDIETGGAVVMSPVDRALDAGWRRPRPDDFAAYTLAAT